MSGKGNRDVKSMRKDWNYGGRNFCTVVQWDGTGLGHVIVYRAPENPVHDEVHVTDGGRFDAKRQVESAVRHAEEQAKKEFDEREDPVYSSLSIDGFVQDNNTPPHPDFEEFHSHNDAVEAAGGCLDPMNMPSKKS